MDTRGVRNNNPGNIRKSRDKWQGLAEIQNDPAFFTFSKPEYGIRAMTRILINYQAKYGLTTVRGIIGRWAPPNENDTEAYIRAVAKAVGVTPEDDIVLTRQVLGRLVPAIIRHECAGYVYPKDVLEAGLSLALPNA